MNRGMVVVLMTGVAFGLYYMALVCLLLVRMYLNRRKQPPARLGCGCLDGGTTYFCKKCGHTRCPEHARHPHACADEAELASEDWKDWEAEMRQAQAPSPPEFDG